MLDGGGLESKVKFSLFPFFLTKMGHFAECFSTDLNHLVEVHNFVM